MKYVVILVHQYYENIEDLECLGLFSSAVAANAFIHEYHDKIKKHNSLRLEYINNFVDGLTIDTSEDIWQCLLKYNHFASDDYGTGVGSLVNFGQDVSRFSSDLKLYLEARNNIKQLDYDPTEKLDNNILHNGFVVKVPE